MKSLSRNQIIIAVALLLFIILMAQNWTNTEVKLLFLKVEMPRFILLLVVGVLGYVVGRMWKGKQEA